MKKLIDISDADLTKVIGVLHEPDTQLGFVNPSNILPIQLHCIPNGTRDGKPSFSLVSIRRDNIQYVSQMSLKMLSDALEDIGYEIKKKT